MKNSLKEDSYKSIDFENLMIYTIYIEDEILESLMMEDIEYLLNEVLDN